MIVGLLLAIICLVAFLWPEVSFALFLCAGAFKADPRLAAIAELIDPTLLLFIATLAGIVIQVMRKRLLVTIPDRQLLVPYYLFAMIMVASLTYTPAPIYGQEKTLRFLLLTSFALFAPGVLFTRQKAISRFMITFVSFAFIFSLLSIMANWGESGVMYKSGLGGSNYLALGRTAGTGALICLFFYVIPSFRWFVAIIRFSVCIFLSIGILFSGARGPLIALLLSILVVSLFMLFFQQNSYFANRIKQKLLLVNFLMFASITGFLFHYADKVERIFYRLELLLTSSGGESVAVRFAIISSAIDGFLSFPTVLIGLGIGGFSDYYSQLDDMRGIIYPHNILLETAVELGLFALIAISAWLFFSIRKIYRMPEKESFYKMTFLALLVFTFFNAMVSGDFNDNRMLFFSIGTILTLKTIETA